ncbi:MULTISPECIES: XRE family transcriptional regulator [unclassified Streptomyces]|uniref:XRE family transcriptional regulator n=1 Tax=Streptomyces millisiae TaxID=3075542 RepID=A0ABU2LN09_9ACTN|nr:XRE family transcriptional regulator [Streptomyces sp. DSM 44918]MDT0318938.1 XRE family transcriptional regulator [Streptomyces sp. DSM 44918]
MGGASDPGDSLDEVVTGIGERVRSLRIKKGMTLLELATETGLSASMLSTVERGRTSPSLGTLHRIAEALGVRMASLFVRDGSGDSPVSRRADQVTDRTAGGAVRRLALFRRDQDVEVYVDEYPAGASHAVRPSHHPGHEFGVVVAGSLEVEVNGGVYDLAEGDAIQYAAQQPHLIRNPSDAPAHAVWVNLRRL